MGQLTQNSRVRNCATERNLLPYLNILCNGAGSHFFLKRIWIAYLPFADHTEGQVGQWGQVSTGPDSSLFGDPGQTGSIEGADHLVECLDGNSGITFGQRVDPQGHQHPNALQGKWLAHSGRMGANQILLQLLQLVRWDDGPRKLKFQNFNSELNDVINRQEFKKFLLPCRIRL